MSRRRKKSARLRWPQSPVKSSPGRLGLSIAVLFLFSLAHLSGMNRTLVLAQRVEELQKSCEELQRSVDRLTLEIAQESGGGRVVELARRRLGMVFPEEQTEVLAVLPAATSRGGSPWMYFENALVIATESIQRQLSSSAQAQEEAVPDSSGGP